MDDVQPKTKGDEISDEDVIARLEAWFPGAQKYWKPHHEQFNKIKKFVKVHGDGAQWDKSAYDSRNNSNPPRITLTENLLGPFVAQVVNDIKRSNFSIQVKPRDEGTDIKLAKVRQGLLRGVQLNGGWQQALGQSADDQVTGGLGAFRLITRYPNPKTFRKELKYIALDDPTRMLHGDGTHKEADYSDVTDSLVYEPYSNERFKAEFGKDPKEFLGRSDTSPVWGNHAGPWVSEYFFKQEIEDELVMYGKEEIFLSELSAKAKKDAKLIGLKVDDLIAVDKSGEQIRRKTMRCQIWWCKLAGKQVLQKEKWPGYWIPNFVVNGRKVVVEGETFFYGLAAPAVDAQKRHNFAVSAHTERLALSPKAPIWAAVESIPTGMQGDWDNINSTNKAVMYYNSRDASGQPIPPPHRENPIQSDPGFLDLLTVSEQGIKGTMGMWESALGQKSNEKTGVAIRARESQADTGNFDWGLNLAVCAEHAGRVTDELINKIIDVPTQVRIVGEDDKEEVIWAASLEKDQENPDQYFDLNRGEFDILCKMTPSADTKRDETTAGLQTLFQSAPELAEILSDFFVNEQDWRLADKATERIRKFLAMKYPGVVSHEGDGKDQPQIPPEVQQHIQQMQQQMQQMGQQLQDAQKAMQENQSLKIENQSIKASKQIEARQLEIEQFKADTDRMKAVGAVDANKQNMLLESDKAAHTAAVEVVQLGHDRAKAHSAHELQAAALEQAREQAAQAAEATAADAGQQSTPEDVKEPGSSMEG